MLELFIDLGSGELAENSNLFGRRDGMKVNCYKCPEFKSNPSFCTLLGVNVPKKGLSKVKCPKLNIEVTFIEEEVSEKPVKATHKDF